MKEFNGMDVSKHFWIDTRNCRCERKINKQCIFELFGAISQESAVDVRSNLVERVCLDPLFYKRIGHVILGFKNLVLNVYSHVYLYVHHLFSCASTCAPFILMCIYMCTIYSHVYLDVQHLFSCVSVCAAFILMCICISVHHLFPSVSRQSR